ncbi:hypothetical protein [Aneurinibacillus aneurinilyticus]|uniref:YxiG family protein n=1 Tax=Aneurinibacillus aneurinilyticus TaxID=1391 RepID=UPI0011DCBBF3|nr:hypothetical protein [Aneurinibacillus aneurinilyticus]MED0706066.1 hypothetical protein [Aneurinibacillus aneurinilyticus]MED0726262.1 hypothetical protein [Aneurinibacillus aneurinilyticus]MED0732641.1 hypothetical protein [Aneurinibacillus aneurinilyticus]MED0739777.1 hypothetical protein [Aneurinibacillus aneurinilyticus]
MAEALGGQLSPVKGKGYKIEIPNGIGTISIKSSSKSWINQYFSSANFALELWNSMLLIKARSITINDYEFEVGYPTLQ